MIFMSYPRRSRLRNLRHQSVPEDEFQLMCSQCPRTKCVNVDAVTGGELAWYGAGGGAMQAGGGWFVPWTMGMQKFAVALPMGGVVPLVPPLLAALPPAPPPLRLIAPPMQHQARKVGLDL
ncbi:unnamed protein product [Colias eurytheme]|nr:unnamed protein product [Colias eurytheme]